MAGVVSYYAYDLGLSSNSGIPVLVGELPLAGVTWSQRLNAAGSLAGDLELADTRIQALDPWDATRPSRTLLIVDVDGSAEWAGIIWTRSYDRSTKKLSVGAQEVWSYFSRRIQVQDYSTAPTSGPAATYWNANPAPAPAIACGIVADAVGAANSAFPTLGLNQIYGYPGDWQSITPSYPTSQHQQVDRLVSSLAGMAYGTGFDFAVEVAWGAGQAGGTPNLTFTTYFPRRGRVGSASGLVLEDQSVVNYTWPEDGTQQATKVIETISTISQSATTSGTTPEISAAVDLTGYPLLENVASSKSIGVVSNPTTWATDPYVQGIVYGDLWKSVFPVFTPAFTTYTFDKSLPLGSFLVGDDVRVVVAPDERFPTGVDTYLRIVGLDVAVPQEGRSTMTLTFDWPLEAALNLEIPPI